MKVRKAGKCVVCRSQGIRTQVIQWQEFADQQSMFDPAAEAQIKGDVAIAVKAWRDAPIHCPAHVGRAVPVPA